MSVVASLPQQTHLPFVPLCVKGMQREVTPASADPIPHNVSDLLDQLIQESVQLVGKPVELMSKEDKVRAIGFLNDTGAFLITKSGDKVRKYFGISKYTMYSYMEEAKQGKEAEE